MVPLQELDRHDGFDVTFRDASDNLGPSTVTGRDLEGYDIIVGQRFNSHKGLEVWRRARTPFSRLVYDLDDDIWNINAENWAAYQLYRRGDIQDAIEHSAQVADLVTVTTPVLAEVFRSHGVSDVAVLPNYVPGWVPDLPRPARSRPAVGWQGGASHGADIALLADPVRRFLKRFPGWDLQLVGTDYRPTFKVKAERALFSSWIRVTEDPHGYFQSMDYDVALVPLCDNVFNASKSSLKALEHMARGIPVLASDCEVYRDVVKDGVNGFLIRYDHQWLSRMSELASDDALREKMSAAALATARERVIERHWWKWQNAYRSLFR
jgi:glycosyltransferase involved in cell wall biosynthesis